ncbi:MAG: bifunctional alpha,alpha-trehalose-phosphate synthase (UDP-forming)/trehalose-phosphatase [Spirochaetales bacterium]|nr:bifunctional alpha,alpha-trehalose-phosphate synthase (UDP-forming)/trehalose-phosphatase [Spirochaetales bacterium]
MENKFKFGRIVVVSYRLPFKIEHRGRSTKFKQSSGGLVSAILSLSKGMENLKLPGSTDKLFWAGISDTREADFPLLKSHTPDFELAPIQLARGLNDQYYGGFCNSIIWPLFHYFPSLVNYDESHFRAYKKANTRFLEVLAEHIRPDDFIWINDYQLFLLPAMIRELYPNANIGFFLHIPFPNYEIFRLLPHSWEETVLKGMLGADLVGFHTLDYALYFKKAVSNVLGYESTSDHVLLEDRLVGVGAFPIGIDFIQFNRASCESKEVEKKHRTLKSQVGENKLIFSIDRLDYTKGMLQRLHAYEYFLGKYPQWHNKVIYNMVVIPSRDSIKRYREMKKEIEATVGRINGKFGSLAWLPIVYQYKSLSFSELVALYSSSDIGLITPLRDGMNLVSKEYIASQTSKQGVLILSEMAGAASELSEAFLINPVDKKEVADTIHKALVLPDREKSILTKRMQKRIKDYDVYTWALDFIDSLIQMKKEQEKRKVTPITRPIKQEILSRYTDAGKRVIFLDYDGTLVPFSKVPELAIPNNHLLNILSRLSRIPQNNVVIISGRDRDFLDEWFHGSRMTLIAEHGAFIRYPDGDWANELTEGQAWKEKITPILQKYMDQNRGSFLENKAASIAWHYRNLPGEIGKSKANDLLNEIQPIIAEDGCLQVLGGNKVIEIKQSGYDKGVSALKILKTMPYDFVFAMGDDRTDEELFKALPQDAVTVKVGMTSSYARYNIRGQGAVRHFLIELIKNG